MRVIFCVLVFFCSYVCAESPLDLETYPFDCIAETKRIQIEQVPDAFNPSFIKWQEGYLMCYRRIERTKVPRNTAYSSAEISFLELVVLDKKFDVLGCPHRLFLDHPDRKRALFIAEDGRLITKDDGRLYLIYSGTKDEDVVEEGFRVYVAELGYEASEGFYVMSNEVLTDFGGETKNKREKNWTPFIYNNELYLSYSISPHKILKPLLDGSGQCQTVTSSLPSIVWDWGELRGGTPAIPICENYYLSFFHSSIPLTSIYSQEELIPHYFMGAYLFQAIPPFEIKKISPEPIIGKNFYKGKTYHPYWHPVRVIFPGGIIIEDDWIWVAYGRQDHEIWVMKIQKSCLLQSLINVSTIFE